VLRFRYAGCGRIGRVVAGLAFGAFVLSVGASAQADERTEARAHFKKGMGEIANGQYDAGIEELKRAYDILPHPNVLYNIARAYVDVGDLENAVAYYKKYLEGSPKDRDEVAQIVAALETRIRKQQAEILEAQRMQNVETGAHPAVPPAPARPGATGEPGTTPAPGPGATEQPGAVARAPRSAGGRGAGLPSRPAASLPAEGLKTEEVFEETVVTASKAAQSPLDAPNSTSIITEQDIRLSGITKIPELLRRLAGADIMETTGSQTEVSLRGFNQRLSNRVLVLVDGRSTYVDLLGSTIWALLSISVEDIERIEVVRGPGSALYGADAFNGVINIITKRPGEGDSGFNVGYGDRNTTHGSVWVSGRNNEVAYRFSAGYDYLPRWSREVPDHRADVHVYDNDQSTAQRTQRLDGTVTDTLSKDVTVGLQGGYAGGNTEVLAVGPISDMVLDPVQATDLTAFINSKHFEARAFWNSYHGANALNAAYLGQSLLPATFDLNVVDVEAQYVDVLETGKDVQHDLHIGLNYRLKNGYWTYLGQEETENHVGFFVHDGVKIGKRVAVVADYRADYVPYLNNIVQSPRGSILVHPSNKSTIRAIVGTAFRTPTFLESYVGVPIQLPVAGGSEISLPTSALKPEHILTTELGYLNSDSDYFTVDSAFFYNRADNLTEVEPNRAVTIGDIAAGSVPAGASGPTGFYPIFGSGFENQCQRYDVYGAELGARVFPVEGLDVYANTTLMNVKQDNSGCSPAQLALLVNDARTSAVKVNTGIQLRTRAGIDASVDVHYVSAQDWAEQVVNVQRQAIVYESFHVDPYTLVNASVGYRFLRNHGDIRAVAFNLLDDQHREHPFGEVLDRRLMGFFSWKF
jgi:iron complex outermembrane receptor protein